MVCLVTVVIPCFGHPELVRAAVRSVLAQDLEPDEYEVLVVDSSRDDANREVVRELAVGARTRLECLVKEPEGPGPSRNLGARHGSGEFLAFMDSDCEASPGWLRAGLAAFEPGVGLVQGRVLPDPDGRPGVFSHYITVGEEGFLYETANMFYRREAFEATGGFGRDLHPRSPQPVGGEDTRVAWRAKRLGWTSRFAPDALVYHAVRPMPVWKWIVNKRLVVFPDLLREFPEMRRHFFLGYFYDRNQALLLVALAGIAAAGPLGWAALALCAPYVLHRASESSNTLRGPLKLLRVLVYLARDGANMAILLAASARYGRLLI